MTIPSPVSGQIVSLEKVSDSVFASGAMGQGFAVVPTEGKVIAPVSGQVTAIFASKHAIGIRSENGMEILIHVGIDTVRLDGTHFELHVAQDQKIEPGDVLITFDIESIQAEGYDIITPVIFTNLSEERQITIDQDQISVSEYNKPAFA